MAAIGTASRPLRPANGRTTGCSMKATFHLTKNNRKVEVAHVGNGDLCLFVYEPGKPADDLSLGSSSEDCHIAYNLIVTKAEARAIASAIMGCAAEA